MGTKLLTRTSVIIFKKLENTQVKCERSGSIKIVLMFGIRLPMTKPKKMGCRPFVEDKRSHALINPEFGRKREIGRK